MSPIIDISDWKYEKKLNASGSKEKRWYRNPQNDRLYLFKLPISLTSDSWINIKESSGEMRSEKIASEIGSILGLNTHNVEIASLKVDTEIIDDYDLKVEKIRDDKIYGALCCSFLEDNESLIEGADMIMDFDHTYDRKKLRGEYEIYSYDLLMNVFSKYGFLDDLKKMIIFDTLIGNTDRHQDNFGIIRNEVDKRIRFAPFYDNSSSLGRELTESRILLLAKDTQAFNAYIHGKKASSLIRWGNLEKNEKLNAFVFFKKVMEISPELIKYHKMLYQLTDSKIDKLIFEIPSVMTEVQQLFVSKVLKIRRDILLKEFLKYESN
ncbi:HipA domain-containing protein [Paenibacillus donghaensis]|uniref:Phosphatidylinositol kinase n=1 Tax=Paenibacillus donghaensis TaxID=414771 RepID=A0A2Z2K9B0_9BACL|nr:HipA domain-containing protein [Paenibacillus donghaensis]ASA21977.1 phosphatidylinositol kinase [Paenibacillus donghaensis]